MIPDLPLITPASIKAIGPDALPVAPPAFCHVWTHEFDEDDPAESTTVWGIGKTGKTGIMITNAMESALVLEACRFGPTIVTNRNTPRRSTVPTTLYAKFVWPDAATDNITVHRLLGGAEAGEQVSRADIIPTDLRGASKRKSGGASKKGAWETIYGHCKRYAEKVAKEEAAAGKALPFTVGAYLSNLEALYLAVTGESQDQEAAQ